MRQGESILVPTAAPLPLPEPERTSWKSNLPYEKQSATGNNHVGNIPEGLQTEHRGMGGRASAYAGSMRAQARQRSPKLPARTVPPAAEPTTIWQLHDA